MVGDIQRKDTFGDRPCQPDRCRNQHLSHVVVFHADDYKPLPRWTRIKNTDDKTTYIGFHTTTPDAAVSIIHSEFRPSSKGMLGKGVYFARSKAITREKAIGGQGACIIAEIRMGKVYEFHKTSICPTRTNPQYNAKTHSSVNSSEWHKDYDTCYMNHTDENKDEFCIKDPKKQIIKWIVIVDEPHDEKVAQYGLDTEFDSTKCYCV